MPGMLKLRLARSMLAISAFAMLGVSIPIAGARASTPSRWFSFYNQSGYLSSTENLVTQGKLLFHFGHLGSDPGLGAYLGVAIDQDTRSSSPALLYNDNHVAPLAGAAWRLSVLPVAFFAEYRQPVRLGARPASRAVTEPELRLGALTYRFTELARLGGAALAFGEGYAESVFNSRLGRSVSLQSWAKLGARYGITKALYADLYAEGLFRRSTLREMRENLQEAGPGARLGLRGARTSAALSVRRGFGTSARAPGRYAEWAGLLVLSGEL